MEQIKQKEKKREPIDEVYYFRDGKEFRITENDEGLLSIVVKDGDKIIIDFERLLADGYKFVAEPYVRRLEQETGKKIWSDWQVDQNYKLVELGHFDGVEDILGLLHEIGHMHLDQNSKEQKIIKRITEKYQAYSKAHRFSWDEGLIAHKVIARQESVRERRAWAYAVEVMKNFKHLYGLDIKEVFPSFESLKIYINDALSSYREHYENLVSLDPNFEDELRRLFDKPNK